MGSEPFSPNRLKEAMNGMSNIELATKLGCARSNISMYLNGTRTPNKMTIQLMSICLGVSPAWLAGLDVPKYIKEPIPVTKNGSDNPLDARLNELLAQAADETKRAMIVLLEQSQKS